MRVRTKCRTFPTPSTVTLFAIFRANGDRFCDPVPHPRCWCGIAVSRPMHRGLCVSCGGDGNLGLLRVEEWCQNVVCIVLSALWPFSAISACGLIVRYPGTCVFFSADWLFVARYDGARVSVHLRGYV